MPSAFLCGADSELYPVAPRLLAKRIETGRRTLSAPAKAAMPADLAWASCKLWSKALTLRRRRSPCVDVALALVEDVRGRYPIPVPAVACAAGDVA